MLCDRVAIIDRGELLALGTVDELKTSLGWAKIIHVEGAIPARAVQAVRKMRKVRQASRANKNGATELTVVSEEGSEILSGA